MATDNSATLHKAPLELAEVLEESTNLLVELEGFLAEPDPHQYRRVRDELLPRLTELRHLMRTDRIRTYSVCF
jgi:hypothetical protein